MLSEKQRIAILRRDRRTILAMAPYVTRIANWVLVIWAALFSFSLLKAGAGEAAVILAVLGVPVGLFWLLGWAMPRLAKHVDENWR